MIRRAGLPKPWLKIGKQKAAMSTTSKVFLLTGNNALARDKALKDLKQKVFPQGSSCGIFNYYADTFQVKTLQEEIFMPSFDQQKLIIFRGTENFQKDIKKFLSAHLEKIAAISYVVFESDWDVGALRGEEDDFFDLLLKRATVVNAVTAQNNVTVNDLSDCLRRNDLAGALYAVNRLFDSEGDFISQLIIGMLTSRAAYLVAAEKARVLNLIFQADRSIKEKGNNPKLIIETLLIKILKR